MPLVVSGAGEGFFDLLGLPMTLGRDFTHQEHVVIADPNGPPPSVIISYRLWRDLFGSDPRVVGQTLNVLEFNGAIPIVGVAARVFDTPHGTDAWFNVRLDLQGLRRARRTAARGTDEEATCASRRARRPEHLWRVNSPVSWAGWPGSSRSLTTIASIPRERWSRRSWVT